MSAGSRSVGPAPNADVHDLSALEQPLSGAETPEPATNAFDLFSDLALPSANAGEAEVPVPSQDPQASAQPDLVQVSQQTPAPASPSKKPKAKSKSPKRAPKPKPPPVDDIMLEDQAAPPPSYNDLIPGIEGGLSSPSESHDSFTSPRPRAPTVYIHVDDDPTRFPYHEPPSLPKATLPRNVPRNTSVRRTPSQSSSTGARGSPTASGNVKRKPSATGKSPPKRSSSAGRSPTRVAATSSTQPPSLLDGSGDLPVPAATTASAAPPSYADLMGVSPSRNAPSMGTMSSASSNAHSALPPTADLLSDYGTPGDVFSTPDGPRTEALASVSPSPVGPVTAPRQDTSGAQSSTVPSADLLGGAFDGLPGSDGDLLGVGDFSSAPSQPAMGGADDVFGFGSCGSAAPAAVSQAPDVNAFDDDFFAGGAAAADSVPSQPGAPAGTDADWLTQLGGGGDTPVKPRARAVKAGVQNSRQAAESQESGDVLLQQAIAKAQEACLSLSQERAGRVQGAIAQAHEYVAEKVRVTYNVEAKELRHVRYSPRHKAKALVYSVMSSMMVQAEKQMQAGNVTEEGIHFATLSASKTAASILTKTVEHHLHEAQQEADVAEAYEYRDSIKADIKAWAFQGGTRRGLRNLLISLDKVLWEGATWKHTSLADVSTDAQVKKVLNKARLLLHTDKMARQPEKIRLRAELILIEIDKALKGVA